MVLRYLPVFLIVACGRLAAAVADARKFVWIGANWLTWRRSLPDVAPRLFR